MRDAARNNKRFERRRTPTQDPSTDLLVAEAGRGAELEHLRLRVPNSRALFTFGLFAAHDSSESFHTSDSLFSVVLSPLASGTAG